MNRRTVALAFLSSLLVFGTAAAVVQAEPPPSREAKPGDGWAVSQGTYDGKPLLTRFNVGLRQSIDRRKYPHRVGIAVPFNSKTEDGLPVRSEADELNAIEEQIVASFTAAGESLLAGVITTNNMREFVLYTSDPKAASAKADRLRQGTPSHRIQFVVENDPEWQVFERFTQ